MKAIVLTRGRIATVDDEDFDRVNQFKWYAFKCGDNYYAARARGRQTEFLHQFLVGRRADHKNGDGLDNRRENLRPATQQQNNSAHRRKASGTTSKFRGVSWRERNKRWKSQIKVSRKDIHLGYFEDETDAARAYDAAARKYFGEFASPNFAVDTARTV